MSKPTVKPPIEWRGFTIPHKGDPGLNLYELRRADLYISVHDTERVNGVIVAIRLGDIAGKATRMHAQDALYAALEGLRGALARNELLMRETFDTGATTPSRKEPTT